MPDLKAMLDSIISKSNDEPETLSAKNVTDGNLGAKHSIQCPTTLDTGTFKEKLSMYVLKDIVSAMLNDETSNLDEVIDNSIINHVKNDCGCTCYQYLTNTRDRLKSDLFADIVQEIDDKSDEVANEVNATKDKSLFDKVDAKEILNKVDTYDEFVNKVGEKTREQVINNVADTIVKSNKAPTFDNVGEKLEEKANAEAATNESFIFRRCGEIVYESSKTDNPIDTEMGFNMAVVEFCLNQLDRLTRTQKKIRPNRK